MGRGKINKAGADLTPAQRAEEQKRRYARAYEYKRSKALKIEELIEQIEKGTLPKDSKIDLCGNEAINTSDTYIPAYRYTVKELERLAAALVANPEMAARVTEMKISYNDLPYIPDGLLTHCVALESLDVSNNKLKKLPPLGDARALQYFNASFNQLEGIPAEYFAGCKRLSWVSFSNCELTDAPIFNDSHHMHALHLAGNRISFLPATYFDNLPELYMLQMSSNNLLLPPDFTKALNMHEVWLYGNKHLPLPPNKSDTSKMTFVSVDDKNLTEVGKLAEAILRFSFNDTNRKDAGYAEYKKSEIDRVHREFNTEALNIFVKDLVKLWKQQIDDDHVISVRAYLEANFAILQSICKNDPVVYKVLDKYISENLPQILAVISPGTPKRRLSSS